jgi:hypothetical protein
MGLHGLLRGQLNLFLLAYLNKLNFFHSQMKFLRKAVGTFSGLRFPCDDATRTSYIPTVLPAVGRGIDTANSDRGT